MQSYPNPMRAHVVTADLAQPQTHVAHREARERPLALLGQELRNGLDVVALLPTRRGVCTLAFVQDELGLEGFYTLDGQSFQSLEAVAEVIDH